MAGFLGVADEPQMRFETEGGQRLGQPLHPGSETTCPRIRVRTLEGEYVELQRWFLRLLLEPQGVLLQAHGLRLERGRDPFGRAAKA